MNNSFIGGVQKIISKSRLNDIQLSAKLKILNLLMVLISIISLSVVIYFFIQKEVISVTKDKLSVVRDAKAAQVENLMVNALNHLNVLSEGKATVDALMELKGAYRDLNTSGLPVSDVSMNDMEINLTNYLKTQFLQPVNEKLLTDLGISDVFLKDARTIYLQYNYISSNPNPKENKAYLDKALEPSSYSNAHYANHEFFRNFVKRYGFEDLYLIDVETGHIIYSVNKKPDFATSLISGPYKNSNIATLFKRVNKSNSSDFSAFSDMDFYIPANNEPLVFLASPIVSDFRKEGILILSLSRHKIEQTLANGAQENEMMDVYIAGDDGFPRTELKTFSESSSEFLKTITSKGYSPQNIDQIRRFNTTVLLYPLSSKPATSAIKGISDVEITFNYTDKKVISAYRALEIPGLTWGIVVNKSYSEVLNIIGRYLLMILISAIVILLIVFLIVHRFTGNLVNRIMSLNLTIQKLARGEVTNELSSISNDLLGQTMQNLNVLNSRIFEASTFATKVGQGDFSYEFTPVSENDQLGVSLSEMRNSLEKAKEEERIRIIEDKKRTWSNQGVAKFSDILRQHSENLEDLSYRVISSLVEYLEANQGGVFVFGDEDENRDVMELTGAFAYDRRKYLSMQIKSGEGLVGSCAKEQKTIYLKEIPEDYINISSGLGDALPRALLLVPMIVDKDVLGVIEIASFNQFEAHEIEFIEKIAENVGSTLISARINSRTAKLLEESKIKSEEMAAQEEEMRQNLEELQSTQEEMQRIKEEEKKREEEVLQQLKEQNEKLKFDELKMKEQQQALEKEKILMDALMFNIPDLVYFKDKECKFIRISNSMVKLFPGAEKPEDLIGKSDFDFQQAEAAKKFYNDEQNIMKTEKPLINDIVHEVYDKGYEQWVSTTKMPLYNSQGEVVGIWGISKIITELKKLEIEANKKAEVLQAHQEELELENSMFSSLLNNIKDRITFKDKEGKYIRLSLVKQQSMADGGIKEYLGKTDKDLYGEDVFKKTWATEKKIIEEDKVVEEPLTKISLSDGKVIWAETVRVPFKNKNGEILGTLSITRDKTEVQELHVRMKEVVGISKALDKARSDIKKNRRNK